MVKSNMVLTGANVHPTSWIKYFTTSFNLYSELNGAIDTSCPCSNHYINAFVHSHCHAGSDGATDTLVSPNLPNGRQCFCPGDVETYTCTVVGGSITVWSGTAFDCPGSINLIVLAHDLFSGATAVGTCTNGAINGVGISVDTSGAEECYTSELSVIISANMDGQTVVCTKDTTVIGSDFLRVAGKQHHSVTRI